MTKTDAILYFVMFALSYGLFFYLLLKTNFEHLFKKGKIAEIRIAYFLMSFILASIFSISMVQLVNVVIEIIIN